jgi:hypothetical protein
VPAWDLRLDYYTGNSDNTDTGGAFSVIPGYGPNSRTLMQFRVSGAGGSHPVDDLGRIDMKALTSNVQAAFKSSQDPIIVPQSVYNNVYGIQAPDALGASLSRISDTALSYQPYNPSTGSLEPKVTLEMEPKTIIEDWTMSWGRMNALLGTEVPHTTAINQTSIPQAFNVYRGDKMNHTSVILIRVRPGAPWVRLEGFLNADMVVSEYQKMLQD